MSLARVSARPGRSTATFRRAMRNGFRGLVAVLADGPTVRSALLDVDGMKGPFG